MASYASRLTKGVDYGECGTPEREDSARLTSRRVAQVVAAVRSASGVVAFTGAGISTHAVADFRGPNGVWTCERKGIPLDATPYVDMEDAWPSLTHQAIRGLLDAGIVSYVISQNIDSLHLRSGIPRGQLGELHGNICAEECRACGCVYHRTFDVGSVGFAATGRSCSAPGCRDAPLYDVLLDWNDALRDLEASEQHARAASLVLVLGTSLRVHPACDLPFMGSARVALVNLQATPKDADVHIRMFARTDVVMRGVMQALGIAIPPYQRHEVYVVRCGIEQVPSGGTRLCVRLWSHPNAWCLQDSATRLAPPPPGKRVATHVQPKWSPNVAHMWNHEPWSTSRALGVASACVLVTEAPVEDAGPTQAVPRRVDMAMDTGFGATVQLSQSFCASSHCDVSVRITLKPSYNCPELELPQGQLALGLHELAHVCLIQEVVYDR